MVEWIHTGGWRHGDQCYCTHPGGLGLLPPEEAAAERARRRRVLKTGVMPLTNDDGTVELVSVKVESSCGRYADLGAMFAKASLPPQGEED